MQGKNENAEAREIALLAQEKLLLTAFLSAGPGSEKFDFTFGFSSTISEGLSLISSFSFFDLILTLCDGDNRRARILPY